MPGTEKVSIFSATSRWPQISRAGRIPLQRNHFGGRFGGPIVKDKAWFWFSTRFNRADSFAGIFENKNAFNQNAWTYVPDENAPAINHGEVQQNNLRITWQAAPKMPAPLHALRRLAAP